MKTTNISHTLLATLTLLCAATSAVAQTVTLEQCRSMAVEHNKKLSSAKLTREKALSDMKSYKANFFPQVNLFALDFYNTAKGDITIDGGHLPIYNHVPALGQYVPNVTLGADGGYTLNQYADFPSQQLEWKVKNVFAGGISLLEPLYMGGKISAAYNMAKHGVNMADENIRLTTSEVMVQTDEAYFMAVRAKQLGAVARSYKSLLDELKKNVQGAFEHGMSTRNDIMKVQVKQNEADLSIQKADNAYRLALMNLCHVTGLPLDSPIDVADSIATPTVTTAPADDNLAARPETNILNEKTAIAQQNVKLARSEMLPTVALGAAYNYANGGELAGKRLLDNGAATVGVAVKVNLDIFGSTTNKVRSAKAAHQIAQMEQQDLTEQMRLELAQCRNNVDEAQTELRLCTTALEQAAENMRLSKQQYTVGLEPLSDYMATQATWQQCSANLVNAQCQLSLALTKLRKAAGAL